jgi:hypothetical protein
MRSALFEEAATALEEAHAYPMLSREYRAGVQRAYQTFTLVAIETADEDEREEAQRIADGLVRYLAVDWASVRNVEVRYRNGATEVLRLRGDPNVRERLRDAVAIRVIEPLDYSVSVGEAGMTATW